MPVKVAGAESNSMLSRWVFQSNERSLTYVQTTSTQEIILKNIALKYCYHL